MKVAVIGGGSTYTPELVNGFLARLESFPLKELWLMDIDAGRLKIVGGFAQRMAEHKGAPFKVVLTGDQREAVTGASYVTTQLRVGQMPARRADEYLGRRHGLIGQETTGVGGMAKALRTIPVILKIARDMQELAPGAMLVNFTNPAGLVTEALFRYAPAVPAVGVCNVPITTKMRILEGVEKELGTRIDPARAELKTLGLNHLSWHRGFTLDGEDLWPRVMESFIAELKAESKPEWDVRTIKTLRLMPNYYLRYFYYTDQNVAAQEKWPPSRAEEVMEIEKGLLQQYADPAGVPPLRLPDWQLAAKQRAVVPAIERVAGLDDGITQGDDVAAFQVLAGQVLNPYDVLFAPAIGAVLRLARLALLLGVGGVA